jgi:hypothetical protein
MFARGCFVLLKDVLYFNRVLLSRIRIVPRMNVKRTFE